MNKRLKTAIIILSSIIFSVGMSIGFSFFVVYNMDNWGYSTDKYNGEYSGKIDSYLDVYKNIWNAATPEEMNVDKAYGYDKPIKFNARNVIDFVSGFEFTPVWRKGSIYDAREFKPIYNYIFTIDFSDYEYAPNPYYNGKVVNAVLGFGTVRYELDKFGEGERNNVRYLLLECDGRIESFANSVTFLKKESNLDDDELDEVNAEVSFDESGRNTYSDSFGDFSLISRIDGTLVDQDKTIIGLNYGRPVSHRVTCGYFISDPNFPTKRSLKMFFFQEKSVISRRFDN